MRDVALGMSQSPPLRIVSSPSTPGGHGAIIRERLLAESPRTFSIGTDDCAALCDLREMHWL